MRSGGSCGWHNREAGPHSVDRPAFNRNRNGEQEQGADPMALVYSLLLSRGSRQHMLYALSARVSSARASSTTVVDRGSAAGILAFGHDSATRGIDVVLAIATNGEDAQRRSIREREGG